MKITWIGQAGLILKSQGKTVIVDPYLSDSVKKVNPHNYRRVPVDTNLFGIKPDITTWITQMRKPCVTISHRTAG